MTREEIQEKLVQLALTNMGKISDPREKALILEVASDLLPEGDLKNECNQTAAALHRANRHQLKLTE